MPPYPQDSAAPSGGYAPQSYAPTSYDPSPYNGSNGYNGQYGQQQQQYYGQQQQQQYYGQQQQQQPQQGPSPFNLFGGPAPQQYRPPNQVRPPPLITQTSQHKRLQLSLPLMKHLS